MSEKTQWTYEYGIEFTTPHGVSQRWDREDYPQGAALMEKDAQAFNLAAHRVGAQSVSTARVIRRKKYTRVTTWVEKAERI